MSLVRCRYIVLDWLSYGEIGYPFVWQPKPTLAGGAARAQVASLPCILHNILLVISIIRMKSLLAVPLLTEGHFTKNTASN
jgi:hypothetical protein